uniref:Uncharacterized protein n=1 Tax=Setaria viridis TaxID=4556 RepID=A0A4U6VC28_SETVI|nr:hypothetical protein SEVIR_3G217760v2 [Setaria viridis]
MARSGSELTGCLRNHALRAMGPGAPTPRVIHHEHPRHDVPSASASSLPARLQQSSASRRPPPPPSLSLPNDRLGRPPCEQNHRQNHR